MRSYSITALIMLAVAATAPAQRAQAQAPRVGVLCQMSAQSAFPFGAGTDRCFQPINGKTLVPTAVAACFIQGNDYTRVTFVFSAVPSPQCGGLAAYGNPATKAQYEPGLAALAAKERAFVLEHLGSTP